MLLPCVRTTLPPLGTATVLTTKTRADRPSIQGDLPPLTLEQLEGVLEGCGAVSHCLVVSVSRKAV